MAENMTAKHFVDELTSEEIPKLSVVMSVFNNEADLAEAIDSILSQTFDDFEFIIIDDCSTDDSAKILNQYAEKDGRIQVLTNSENRKLATSLNRGISVAKGEYIVRMDADDVALPDRFQQQYNFMQSNGGIAVCGSWVQVYEQPEIVWRTNTSPEKANCAAFFESCFHHPTVFIRKAVIDEYGAYDESVEFAQDCHLWSRLAFDHGQKLANLPVVLLRYRSHPEKQRDEYRIQQHDKATALRQKNLLRLGIEYSTEEYRWHDALCCGKEMKNARELSSLTAWIRRLELANKEKGLLSVPGFKRELEQKLLRVCLASAKHTAFAIFEYMKYSGTNDLLKNIYRSARMMKSYILSPNWAYRSFLSKDMASAPKGQSKNSQKIAFLVDSMAGGGAERVTLNLANEYNKRGYDVDLVLARKQGPYLEDVDEGIRVIDLNVTRFWTYLLPLIKYYRQEKPDVMLSATTILNLIAIFTKMLSLSKTHLVISEHINIISFAKTGGLQRPKIVQKVMKFLYPIANEIVAVSDGAANDLATFSGIARGKVTAIYNGVIDQHKLNLAQQKIDHPWFSNGDNPSDIQIDKNKNKTPVIVAVGRLQEQKDYAMLLQAFALLLKNTQANLLVLGEGEQRSSLEQLAKELDIEKNLSLHGFDDNPFKYMANADLFVLSSLYEGLPTVLIEALACGCPVVSTNCPSGPQEILNNGEFGSLIAVGDAQAFAEAMILSLTTTLTPSKIKKERQRLIDHGKQFNVDKAFIEYSKVLGLMPRLK